MASRIAKAIQSSVSIGSFAAARTARSGEERFDIWAANRDSSDNFPRRSGVCSQRTNAAAALSSAKCVGALFSIVRKAEASIISIDTDTQATIPDDVSGYLGNSGRFAINAYHLGQS